MRTTIHLVHKKDQDNRWLWKKADSDVVLGRARTKREAIVMAKAEAKSFYPFGQLIIHKRNGQIQTEYTYGNDPHDSKG
jgi:hypothetical protein